MYTQAIIPTAVFTFSKNSVVVIVAQRVSTITGADQALRVNKSSKNLQATLNFCNWWYTSDYGKKWFSLRIVQACTKSPAA